MPKAKKRVALRKETSKPSKASAKPARKTAAKSATPKKRSPKAKGKMTQKKAPMAPVVEDTIIDVIEEPIPGVVRVTEYETITTTVPTRGNGPKTDK